MSIGLHHFGPQVRHERGQAAWINRTRRTARRGLATPRRGHEVDGRLRRLLWATLGGRHGRWPPPGLYQLLADWHSTVLPRTVQLAVGAGLRLGGTGITSGAVVVNAMSSSVPW
jgi:hypothetical protein